MASPAHRLRLAAAAIAGAVLATCVLITADATSVYQGESLAQVLLMLLAGVLASFGSIPFWPDGPRGRVKIVLLAALVGWLVVSTISATWLADGRAAWNGCWHIIGLLIFGLVLRSLCRNPAAARAVARLVILGAIALSVHAVHQRFISMPATRAAYEQDPDKRLAELNIDAPPGSAMRAQYESRLYSSEPMATFALTNSLAVLLSGALVALGMWIASQLRQSSQQRLALGTASLAWGLIATAWLLTKSRAAWLSVVLVAALCAFLWWRGRRSFFISERVRIDAADQVTPAEKDPLRVGSWRGARPGWMTATAVGALLVFAAFVSLLSRDSLILSEAPKSIAYRLEYWQASSKMILDHPLTGVGLGNFQSYYPRYKSSTASEIVADPHNWIFDIAATCSLPALALLVIGLAWVGRESWLGVRRLASANISIQRESAATKGQTPAVDRPLVKAIWIGAALGWALTAALQWLLHEAIDLEASSLGIVVGIIAIALMRSGPQPNEFIWRSMGLAASVTMIVCLLVSGSWQASGLALPLAAWLAVSAPSAAWFAAMPSGATGRTTNQAALSPAAHSPAAHSNETIRPRVAVRLIAIGALLTFVALAWRPVNLSWTHYHTATAAFQRGDLATAREAAAASVSADPLDPTPRRLLVQVLADEASAQSLEQFEPAVERVQSAIAELLDCDPAAAGNWVVCAETLVTLAAHAEDLSAAAIGATALTRREASGSTTTVALSPVAMRLLERADAYFVGAVERYPSNVGWHAQRAVLLWLLEQRAASQIELQAALALSEATPHSDRKLAMQQIWLPPALAAGRFPPEAVMRPSAGSPWVQAEPVCDFLRMK